MIVRFFHSPAVLLILLLFSVGVLYVSTLPQAIGYGDAGLLAAAAASLGVPHPPGFPSYMIIAHLFTLIPIGSILLRLQLVSVVSALLLLAFLFWYLKKESGTLPALLSCIALAGSYGFWSQSLNVETFLPTNLVIVLVSCLVWQKKPTWWLVGIVLGFGLGFNPIVVAVIPGLIFLMYQRGSFSRWIVLKFIGCTVLVSLIIYSYLPLRASAHLFVNWSDPSTINRFFSHIFGGGLSIASDTVINGFTGSVQWYLDAWLRFLTLTILEFAGVPLLLVGIGIYSLVKKDRPRAVFWLLLIISNISLAGLYTGGNRDSWFMTSFIAMAVFLGEGIQMLQNGSPSSRFSFASPVLISVFLVVVAFLPLFVWFPTMKKQAADTGSYTYIYDMYYKLPDNALLIGGGETFNSLTLYAHEALKFRPDVMPVDFTIYYGKQWYRSNIKDQTSKIKNQSISRRTKIKDDTVDMPKFTDEMEFSRILEQFARTNTDKRIFVTGYLLTQPVYANSLSPAYIPRLFTLRQNGIVYELVPPGSKAPDTLLEHPSEKRNTWFLETNYRKAVNEIQREYALSLEKQGDQKRQNGDTNRAFTLYEKAGAVAPLYFDQNRLREKMEIPASASAVPSDR